MVVRGNGAMEIRGLRVNVGKTKHLSGVSGTEPV